MISAIARALVALAIGVPCAFAESAPTSSALGPGSGAGPGRAADEAVRWTAPCAVTPPGALLGGDPRSGALLAGRSWVVKREDNICGLREASQLSNPAIVDYDTLFAATPEMKKLEREGIDPAGPEGVQLKAQAADRVAEATEDVRQAQGHCSVWKAIQHKDGRSVPDLTSLVLAKL